MRRSIRQYNVPDGTIAFSDGRSLRKGTAVPLALALSPQVDHLLKWIVLTVAEPRRRYNPHPNVHILPTWSASSHSRKHGCPRCHDYGGNRLGRAPTDAGLRSDHRRRLQPQYDALAGNCRRHSDLSRNARSIPNWGKIYATSCTAKVRPSAV